MLEPVDSSRVALESHVAGYVWVRALDLVGLDVVARHPGRRAMFYFSRRVMDGLVEAGVEDLTVADPLMICHRHD